MARSLAHLFSTAAFDPPHDALADEDGDELLQWIVGRVWGDAMRVGRHDWVYAGCPVTISEICTSIQKLNGPAFDSLGRLLSAGTQPDFLKRSGEPICAAAVTRLETSIPVLALPSAENVIDPNTAVRERLYDIITRFPSRSAIPALQQLQEFFPTLDGDPSRPIGAALAEALEKCGTCE
jgi:hypothetical protein